MQVFVETSLTLKWRDFYLLSKAGWIFCGIPADG